MVAACTYHTAQQLSEVNNEKHFLYSDASQIDSFKSLLSVSPLGRMPETPKQYKPEQWGGGLHPANIARATFSHTVLNEVMEMVNVQPWRKVRLPARKEVTWEYLNQKEKTKELVFNGRFPLSDTKIANWRYSYNTLSDQDKTMQQEALSNMFYDYFGYKFDRILRDIKGEMDRSKALSAVRKEYRDVSLKFGFDPETIDQDIFKVNGLYENIYTQARRVAIFMSGLTGEQLQVDHIIPVIKNGISSFSEADSFEKIRDDVKYMLNQPKHKGENLSLLVRFMNAAKSNKNWNQLKGSVIKMFNNFFGQRYSPESVGEEGMKTAAISSQNFVRRLKDSLARGVDIPPYTRGGIQFEGISIPKGTSIERFGKILQSAGGVEAKIADAVIAGLKQQSKVTPIKL